MVSMRILVLGCGNIGFVVAKDLAGSLSSAEIVLADIDETRAEEAATAIGHQNVGWVRADASNREELVNILREFDLVVGALPGKTGYMVCEGAIAAGVDLVDVSYAPEDVMTLGRPALKAGVSILPDCGMSPGLGNILAGHAISRLDHVESLRIFNGGLPAEKLPPLGYVITWSVKDLIDMYMRTVTIVDHGRIVRREPLSGLEEIDFPRVGRLEAFYTDGLRTLLHTVKDVGEMWEKTLRYPGHVERIGLLKALGFFDEKPVKAGKCIVPPREVTAKLFEEKLKKKGVQDLVVMRIIVTGTQGQKRVSYTYEMLDHYDRRHKVTSMARTTAYTTSVVTQLLAEKVITEKGVVPPENLGMNKRVYTRFMAMMRERGVAVKETKRRLP
jgi:lysine 6-dehydrogenase